MRMKRFLYIFLCLILCLSLISCGGEKNVDTNTGNQGVPVTIKPKTEPDVPPVSVPQSEVTMPFDGEKTFLLSTGAGGWFTELNVQSDGTFVGRYQDSNMGEGGEGYQGTFYFCDFKGRFGRIEKVDDYSYRMYLEELETTTPQDEPRIDGETLMVPSEPYGMDEGMYMLYLPGTNVTQFPEDFIYWWVMRYEEDGSLKTHLDCYCIHNTTSDTAFFAYE